MWKILGCLIGLILVSGGLAQNGDVFLSGTIMLTGGTMCVQADGDSVADDNCLKVVVVETDTAGQYKVQPLEGDRTDMVWTLADGGNSFATGGSAIVFFPVGGSNLQTVAGITNADAPFIIRLAAETGDSFACLKADGTYTADNGCTVADDLFYFVEEECTVDYCMTCDVDASVVECVTCTTGATGDGTASCTCGENTIANSGADTCDACTSLHTECTACNDDSGAVCTACSGDYVVDATDGCKPCSTLHAECTACNDDSGAVCTACSGDYVVDATDGCKMCADDETLKSDGTECLEHTCTEDNCQQCDTAATCTQCVAGYSLADNACTACEDNEIVVNNVCTDCTTLHAECTDCNDDSGAVCTACNTGYVTNDTVHCESCEDNEIVENDACSDCGDDEKPNTDRDTCLASCDDNCKFCDDATTCGECADGYSVSDGGCTEDTEEENSSTHIVPYLSLLSMAVLLGVMFSK